MEPITCLLLISQQRLIFQRNFQTFASEYNDILQKRACFPSNVHSNEYNVDYSK